MTSRTRITRTTNGLDLIGYFQQDRGNDLLSLAEQRIVDKGDVLINEGDRDPGLFIVTRGLLDVRVGQKETTSVGKRGAGALLGEVSFLTGEGANATVMALEPSELLVLPADVLNAQLKKDDAFAARFFQILGRAVADKLTEQSRRAAPFSGAITNSPELDSRLRSEVHRVKAALSDLETKLAQQKTQDTGESQEEVDRIMDGAMDFMRYLFRDDSDLSAESYSDVSHYLRQELAPVLLHSRCFDQSYTKPRGYAGDFLVIDMFYSQQKEGVGRLGTILDDYFLRLAVCQAVRNRRGLLVEAFSDLLRESDDAPLHISSLACGPAREIFDFFDQLNDPSRVAFHCLDLDFQALSAVSRQAEERGVQRNVHLVQENLILLAAGRHKAVLPPQHMMYSIGLIDYFQDKLVVQLLNWIHSCLRPGGIALLGNFDPKNPDRAFMDHLLEWRLVYRTPDDMRRLFAASNFGDRPVQVRYEQQGINLFASCRK